MCEGGCFGTGLLWQHNTYDFYCIFILGATLATASYLAASASILKGQQRALFAPISGPIICIYFRLQKLEDRVRMRALVMSPKEHERCTNGTEALKM